MKRFKKIAALILLIIVAFVFYTLTSTGFFRSIENKFEGKIIKEIALPGAEDIIVSRLDSFAIISSTAGRTLPRTKDQVGGLYFLDLKNNNSQPIHLTSDFKKPFAPHGISMIKIDSIYKVLAISHPGNSHFIEVFELNGQVLKHEKTLSHSSMISPNDLVMLDENRFYFTNDHKYTEGIMRLLEDYGGLSVSDVMYFDGENYTQVADGIAYANGINLDKKRNLLFVASPRGFLVKVYQKNVDNSLTFIEDIDCKTGVDNIEFDSKGNLWIGSHPNLVHFAEYAKGNEEISPSEIIKIDYKEKGNYTLEQIYMEDGSSMSASTVAATFGNLILMGNVMDDKFLILEKKSN
jgi:arylesterase/paraoxonase